MAGETEAALHEIVEAIRELTRSMVLVAQSNQAMIDAMLMAAAEPEEEDDQDRPAVQYLDGSTVR